LSQIGLLLVASMVIGCAGFEPYEPRDDREEGPKSGLFSGAEGEFVILRKGTAPDEESGSDPDFVGNR
jgi:hypothetical protein